jgi:intracellular sulfur oxidation DsrE/DsrF family protein
MRIQFALSSVINAVLVVLCACAALAQTTVKPPAAGVPAYRVAIQVSENDPKIMNLALNNAKNIADYYKGKGQKVAIEIVTYGPGLHMLRGDTSPVKQRIGEMSLALQEISFAACGNTQVNMARQESKDVPLLSEARVVPSGVVRLMELQRGGYAYIRP